MTTNRAEPFRKSYPGFESKPGDNFGCFLVEFEGAKHFIICSPTDKAWQHVSVSTRNKTPSWAAMSYVKDLFWDDDETAIQYHPPKSEYVNNHNHCLHLWSRSDKSIETPPTIFVGIKSLGVLNE